MGLPRRPAQHTAQHTAEDEDRIRVPLVEERLHVEKRVRTLGEARFRRRVSEETRTVGVDVARERVRVERRTLAPRPAAPAELGRAFAPRTLRIPLFGEAAVARKAPFVTGEVVVHRRRVAETRTVTETLRRQRVEVEEIAAPPQVPAQVTAPVVAAAPLPEERALPVEVAEAAEPSPERADPTLTRVLPAVPIVPIRKVLQDVRAGWERARRSSADTADRMDEPGARAA